MAKRAYGYFDTIKLNEALSKYVDIHPNRNLSEGMSYTCLFRQSILFAKNCSIQVFLTFLFALQRKKKQYILSNVNSHLNFKGMRSFACGVVY